ncbi:MAG: hypothetical protein RLZZ367_1930 [Bacteroidota bacterium]|jgi:hypothetical protein
MVIYSDKESLLFNVKFGRYEGVLTDPIALRDEIIQGGYDFVRVKLLNPGDDLFVRLNRIGLPYHLLDIHRLYELDVTTYTVPPLELPDMQFIPVTAANATTLKQLITDTYTEWPMGFFRNEMLEQYFPLQLQLENFATYISSGFIELTGNPGKRSWILKLNGDIIGCAATEFRGDYSYTPYIGLLPQYRKKHLFTNIARFIQLTIQQAGCRIAAGSARLHNMASQFNFEREGQKYTSHDYVFMIDARNK